MSEQKRTSRRAAPPVEHMEAQAEEVVAVEVADAHDEPQEEVAPRRNSSREIVVQAPQVADMVPQEADNYPDFAISLQEATRRVRLMQEFVREHMVEGEDYGVIPGASNKPTLFKPGAEKLNAIFGLAPIVEITSRIEDWDASFVAYEVKVTLLNKRTGNIEAEGRRPLQLARAQIQVAGRRQRCQHHLEDG
jgi:hypothetical protein